MSNLDTYTFFECSGRYRFTVKMEFIYKRCSHPDKFDCYDLMIVYGMRQYLHNTAGPAIVDTKEKIDQWWINGSPVAKVHVERTIHHHSFHDKLINDILGD